MAARAIAAAQGDQGRRGAEQSRRGPRPSKSKEQFWRAVMRRFTRSAGEVRAFCRAEGLSEPSFYAWRRELARRDAAGSPSVQHQQADSPAPRADSSASQAGRRGPRSRARPRTAGASTGLRPRFLPVTLAPSSGHCIEVLLGNGLVLRVPAHDAAALRMVLELLEQPSC